MKDYTKTFKGIMLGLIAVSVIVLLVGWIVGFEANGAWPVDLMFAWTYVMIAVAALAIIAFGGYLHNKNDKGFLKKVGIVLVALAAVVAVVWLISPGKEAVGMLEQPSASVLKFTDTILNLTYIFGGAAILAIIFSAVYAKIGKQEKKK